MTIQWMSFLIVVGASLIAATLLVTLFSLAVRINDREAPWRRPAAIGLWVLCGLLVLFGIYLIVPALHQ